MWYKWNTRSAVSNIIYNYCMNILYFRLKFYLDAKFYMVFYRFNHGFEITVKLKRVNAITDHKNMKKHGITFRNEKKHFTGQNLIDMFVITPPLVCNSVQYYIILTSLHTVTHGYNFLFFNKNKTTCSTCLI